MFYVVHTLLGGLIGLRLNSLTLIILIAFISHFIIDNIPHWGIGFDKNNFKNNYQVNFNRKLLFIGAIDGIIAIFLLIFMYDKFNSSHLIIGSMASIFPDILSAGYLTKFKHKKKYKKFLQFHSNIQRDAGVFFGIITQIIIALIILKVLF
ncbi:MAG: hypothetical protein Q8N88_00915 [Nanoarchaeota archaeon]|nr:hypothetical protein [Nanoarchaeota archaeon]